MRRFIALALALALFSSGLSACSQPIDNGSSVPAQSQPIVALLALLGLGIGLTAWHHHNEHVAAGGGGGATIFGANFLVPPFIGGFRPVDLVPDPANATLGALEVPAAAGTGKFTELQVFSNAPSVFGTYTLPAGYSPTAVAMDSTGLTWFVNAAGLVQGCAIMTQTTTTCQSAGTFNDGLGTTAARSIAADVNIIVVVADGGNGTVKWWAEQGATATGTGTYASASTSPIFAGDAIELTTQSPSGFTVYHQDGSSDVVTFSVSGSTLVINAQPNMAFSPAPLVAPSNFLQETTSANFAFYSFTGAPAGAYRLTKYESPTVVGLVAPTATSELIELNGKVGNAGAPFVSPLFSTHFDASASAIWAIDQSGDIVNFSPF